MLTLVKQLSVVIVIALHEVSGKDFNSLGYSFLTLATLATLTNTIT